MKKIKMLLAIAAVACIMAVAIYAGIYTRYDTYEQRYRTGNSYVAHNQYKKAINAYKIAIMKDRTRAEAYGAIGALYTNSHARDVEKYNEIERQAELNGIDANTLKTFRMAHTSFIENNAIRMETEDGITFSYYNSDNELYRKNEYQDGKAYRTYYYKYDENDNITSMEIFGNAINAGIIYSEKNTYDEQNRLTERIEYSDEDGKNRYVYFYNADGSPKMTEKYDYDYPNSQYLKSVDYYDNNALVRTHFIRDGYKTLGYESFYDETGFEYKTSYQTYYILREKSRDDDETVIEEYHYDNDDILTQHIHTTMQGEETIKTVTDEYKKDGTVFKTTTLENGIITVTRPTDNIINPRPLTQAEIDRVNKEGKNLAYFNTTYENEENLNLNNIISMLRDVNNLLSYKNTAELATLKKEGVSVDFDKIELEHDRYFRISGQKVRNLLKKYMNITPAELKDSSDAIYSEKTDNYYFFNHGVITPYDIKEFSCVGGVVGDNLVKLYTENKTMTLKRDNSNYYITSVISEDNSDLVAPQPQLPQQSEAETKRVAKSLFIETDLSKSKKYNDAIMAYNIFLAKKTPADPEDYPHLRYGLYELTGDNVPELIIPQEWGYLEIYTFSGGQLVKLATPPAGGGDGGCTILANGMIAGRMSKIEYVAYWFYTYNTDGSVKSSTNFNWNWVNLGERTAPFFDFNGEDVSREEYMRLTEKYLEWYNSDADIEYMSVYTEVPIE